MNWRRRRTALLAVLGIAVGSAGLTSCSSSSGRRSVRVGVAEEPSSLNPFEVASRTPSAHAVLDVVLPQLWRVSPDGTVVGWLADDRTIVEADDGRVMRFSLRERARWSDGKPITVDDIVFTWKVITGDAWPGSKVDYSHLTDVVGEGAQIELRFDRPWPAWQRLFSHEEWVLPEHVLSCEGTDLTSVWNDGPTVGAGPFALDRRTPGLEVVLKRDARFWGARPAYEEVRVLTVPDQRVRQLLLRRGELDVIDTAPATDRQRQLAAIPGVRVVTAPAGGRLTSLYLNESATVFQGNEAIDRKRAVIGLVEMPRWADVLLAGEVKSTEEFPVETADPGIAVPTLDAGALDAGALDTPALDAGVTVVAAAEEPMARTLLRSMQVRAGTASENVRTQVVDAALLDGSWLPSGQFDVALVDELAWPMYCFRCRFASGSIGSSNWSRTGDQFEDDFADRADGGEKDTAPLFAETLLRGAVFAPIWQSVPVLGVRGVEGVAVNSWFAGPLWNVEGWRP